MSQQQGRSGDFFKQFIKNVMVAYSQGELWQSAIVITYYLLFSLFPIVIIIGNVLPLFSINTKPIADYLALILPSEVSTFVMPIVDSLLGQSSTGYLSFGAVIALWSFSCLVNAIRVGMNRIYSVHRTELTMSFLNFILARTITVVITILLIVGLIAVSVFFIWGQTILNFAASIFHFSTDFFSRIVSYRWPVVIVLMVILVLYLNWFLPNVSTKKRSLFPGTIFTVVSWVLLTNSFRYYLNYFGQRWENYGVIGTLIIFMLWMDIGSLLLLIGTDINASIDEIKYGQSSYSNRIRLRHPFKTSFKKQS